MLWITIKRVEKNRRLKVRNFLYINKVFRPACRTQHFILVIVLSQQNSEYSSRDTCHGFWKYQLLYHWVFFQSLTSKETNWTIWIPKDEQMALHELTRGHPIEGRTKKDEAWTSFGRAKNSSFSKQIFFLCKIVLDLVGGWSLFFYLAMVSLTSQACSK